MADVRYFFPVPSMAGKGDKSAAVIALEKLERTCRSNDKTITNCIIILAMLIGWILFAEFIIVKQTYEYVEQPFTQAATDVNDAIPKRMLHRVLDSLSLRCLEQEDDVVLAPYVLVSGKPFLHRVLRMCARQIDLVNPSVVVKGETTGYCVDNSLGDTRRILRNYPITVHSRDAAPVTFLTLDEVCPFMAVLDMLDRKW